MRAFACVRFQSCCAAQRTHAEMATETTETTLCSGVLLALDDVEDAALSSPGSTRAGRWRPAFVLLGGGPAPSLRVMELGVGDGGLGPDMAALPRSSLQLSPGTTVTAVVLTEASSPRALLRPVSTVGSTPTTSPETPAKSSTPASAPASAVQPVAPLVLSTTIGGRFLPFSVVVPGRAPTTRRYAATVDEAEQDAWVAAIRNAVPVLPPSGMKLRHAAPPPNSTPVPVTPAQRVSTPVAPSAASGDTATDVVQTGSGGAARIPQHRRHLLPPSEQAPSPAAPASAVSPSPIAVEASAPAPVAVLLPEAPPAEVAPPAPSAVVVEPPPPARSRSPTLPSVPPPPPPPVSTTPLFVPPLLPPERALGADNL